MPKIKYDGPDEMSAVQAKFEAQKIAFAPMVFQAALALRDLGILEMLFKQRDIGVDVVTLAQALQLQEYGVKVLLEVGLSSGIVRLQEGQCYTLTKTGYFLLRDDLTRINMNFVNDVCYQGMFHLQEAITQQYPAGLKALGKAETIYEILACMPEKARHSWFEFDHYYSDISFPEVLPHVFKHQPKRILDVGGNTGKWAVQCARHDATVEVTIVDLPPQLALARENIVREGLQNRIHLHACNMLSPDAVLPGSADVIWMSQFLDCFSAQQMVAILSCARRVMSADTSLYIMELFWDRQQFEAAAFSLHNISLYFTCLANGNSKFYHSQELFDCIHKAGLKVVSDTDNIGAVHTLLECRIA